MCAGQEEDDTTVEAIKLYRVGGRDVNGNDSSYPVLPICSDFEHGLARSCRPVAKEI